MSGVKGTTRLLEYQGRRPDLAEGRHPRSYGVWVPFQRLGGSLSGPALGQKPQGGPPLPGHRRQNPQPAHTRHTHLPPSRPSANWPAGTMTTCCPSSQIRMRLAWGLILVIDAQDDGYQPALRLFTSSNLNYYRQMRFGKCVSMTCCTWQPLALWLDQGDSLGRRMGDLQHPVSSLQPLQPRCRIPVRFPSSQTTFSPYIPRSPLPNPVGHKPAELFRDSLDIQAVVVRQSVSPIRIGPPPSGVRQGRGRIPLDLVLQPQMVAWGVGQPLKSQRLVTANVFDPNETRLNLRQKAPVGVSAAVVLETISKLNERSWAGPNPPQSPFGKGEVLGYVSF